MKRLGAFIKGVIANAVIVGLVIGVPFGLITLFGGVPASVITTLTDDLASRQQIVEALLTGLLVLVAWLAWLIIAVAVVGEAIAAIRNVDLPAMPGIPKNVQRNAARLVAAGAMMFNAFTASTAMAADSAPSPILPVAAVTTTLTHTAPTPAHTDDETTAPATTITMTEITVEGRSHWWSLAEQHLGDGTRWKEIVDANTGRTMPDGTVITETTPRPKVGWQLHVPTTTEKVPSPHPASPANPTHVVQRGDTLWEVIEDHDGTVDMGRVHIVADQSGITDPDLIYPGDIVRFTNDTDTPTPPPTPTDNPAETPAAETPTAGPVEDPSPTPAAETPMWATPQTDQADTATTEAEQAPATTTAETPTMPAHTPAWRAPQHNATQTPATTTVESTPDSAAETPREQADVAAAAETVDQASTRTWTVIGASGLAVVMLGILEVLRRRRQRGGPTVPAPDDARTEMALRTEARLSTSDIVRRFEAQLRSQLEQDDATVSVPIRLVVDRNTGHLTAVNPNGETHSISINELPPDPGQFETNVQQLMVSVGRAGEAEVFVDLESLGAIQIAGDRNQRAGLFRNIAAQLVHTNAEVYSDQPGVLDEVKDLNEANWNWAQTDREPLWEAIAQGHISSAAAARALDWPYEQCQPFVVLAVDADVDEILDAARPGSSVVVMSSPRTPAAPVKWAISDGALILEDGFKIDNPGIVTVEATEAIRQVVAHERQHADDSARLPSPIPAARQPITVNDDEPSETEPATADNTTRDHATTDEPVHTVSHHTTAVFEPLKFDLMIRLMRDEIDVVDADGNVIDFVGESGRNGRRAPELLALMYHLNRPVTRGDINDNLWFGKAPVSDSTLTSLMSKTRSGIGRDRIATEPGSKWRLLRDGVVTDVEVLDHIAAHVRVNPKDVALLTSQLEQLEVEPLRESSSYDWASSQSLLLTTAESISHAVATAGFIALENGDLDNARNIYRAGLRANSIDENAVQLAMRVESARGNLDGVRKLYDSLANQLHQGLNEMPMAETTALYNELTHQMRRTA